MKLNDEDLKFAQEKLRFIKKYLGLKNDKEVMRYLLLAYLLGRLDEQVSKEWKLRLNVEDLRFAQKLREFNEPLTLDEIAERLGMDRSEVAKRMSRLVKADVMKVFIRLNSKGELVAKYIIL